MNRRNFLSFLAAAPVAALAFDPHRVIFDMGRKLFVPSQRVDYLDMSHWGEGDIYGGARGPGKTRTNWHKVDGLWHKGEVGQQLSVKFNLAQMESDQQMFWKNVGIRA